MQHGTLPGDVRERILEAQRNEITEYHVYHRLAALAQKEQNARILRDIGDCERAHYNFLRDLTGTDVAPVRWKVWLFYLAARFLGLTFGLKLMEKCIQESIYILMSQVCIFEQVVNLFLR